MLSEYSLSRLKTAHVAQVPTPHIVVDEFFPPDLFGEMLNNADGESPFWREVFEAYLDCSFADAWRGLFPNIPTAAIGSAHVSNSKIDRVHGWNVPLTAAVFLNPRNPYASLTRSGSAVLTVPCVPNRLIAFTDNNLVLERTDGGNAVIFWPFQSTSGFVSASAVSGI